MRDRCKLSFLSPPPALSSFLACTRACTFPQVECLLASYYEMRLEPDWGSKQIGALFNTLKLGLKMDYVILGSVLTYVNRGFVLGGKQRRF